MLPPLSLTLSDKVVSSNPMPRQPEIPRNEFDSLAQKTEDSRKNIRRIEGDFGELKNKLTGIEKKLESSLTKKTLAIAAPILVALLGIFLVRDSNQRASKDRSLEDSINSLQRSVVGYGEQMGKSNERIAKVESTLEILLRTILKDVTKGTAAQVKTKLGVAEEFLKEANNRKLALDPEILRDSGSALLSQDAVFNNKELAATAWDVADQLADYQAFLSSTNLIEPISPDEVIRVDVLIPAGEHREYRNSLFEDVTVVLDRGTFINNTFRNCEIIYVRGPVVLENNFFSKTKIRPIRDEFGREFLKQFLKSSKVQTGPPPLNQQ